MKIYFLIFFGFVFVRVGYTQNNIKAVDCKIEAVTLGNDSISVNMVFENLTSDTIMLYKPSVENVNHGLLSFKFLDEKGNKVCEYDYGNWGEIDNINATIGNCDLLMPQSKLYYTFQLSTKLFRCYRESLEKYKQFEFSLHYDHSIFSRSGLNYKLFVGNLTSKFKYN